MPRALSQNFRRDLEEPRSNEMLVILLAIADPTLAEPILVANDVVSYNYNGAIYLGFPFEFELIDDSSSGRIPTGRIRIQNVDRQIGEAVLNLTQSPTVTITILASSDFGNIDSDGVRSPRFLSSSSLLLAGGGSHILLSTGGLVELSGSSEVVPTVEYEASNLMFTNISINAMEVTAELISFDMTSEPWPAVRTTTDRLPGLDP